ncbi:GGDEF domain-containing protein [Yoonia sp. SS1-5]|uniref:diguanylate cyclase n=1 Tax=Yoonia rhodophyticola TaxID=3137370 RepID=A0AAN0M7T4_9RHOB
MIRLPLMLAFLLGLSVLPDFFLSGRKVAPIVNYLPVVLLVAGPLTIALLWALSGLAVEESKRRAITQIDPLTALPNRLAFLQTTRRILPQSGVLLMLQVDDFAHLNERRGRKAGDLCLMALAQRFRELTRYTDIVGRMGGASFAIYLPGATIEQARDVADRICDGAMVVTQTGILRVTISVGAVLANGRTPLDRLLVDANSALDEARRGGNGQLILEDWVKAA